MLSSNSPTTSPVPGSYRLLPFYLSLQEIYTPTGVGQVPSAFSYLDNFLYPRFLVRLRPRPRPFRPDLPLPGRGWRRVDPRTPSTDRLDPESKERPCTAGEETVFLGLPHLLFHRIFFTMTLGPVNVRKKSVAVEKFDETKPQNNPSPTITNK